MKPEGKNRRGEIVKKRKTFLNDDPNRREEGEGVHSAHKIDTPEYQDQIKRVYELFKEGLRADEVYTMLCIEDDKMSEEQFNKLMAYAYKWAENESLKDRENAWQTHMARYENIYEKAMQMMSHYKNIPLDKTNRNDIEQIRIRCTQAMDALKNKEELIGLHDKRVVLEFNDGEATIVDNNETGTYTGIPGYNLDNLSLAEKVELLALIKEARTTPQTGVQRVVVKTRTIQIDLQSGNRQLIEQRQNIDKLNVKDVEYEEMPPDVVSKFTNTREIVPEPEVDPHIIDSRYKELPPNKTAQDTKDSIQNKVLEKLKEQLREKNERKKNGKKT